MTEDQGESNEPQKTPDEIRRIIDVKIEEVHYSAKSMEEMYVGKLEDLRL